MEDEINKLKDIAKGDLVFGTSIELADDLRIIPVFKVKLSYISLDSKIKGNVDGASGSVNLIPICFIEVKKSGIKVHSLTHDFSVTEVMDKAPDFLSGIGKLFDLDNFTKQ